MDLFAIFIHSGTNMTTSYTFRDQNDGLPKFLSTLYEVLYRGAQHNLHRIKVKLYELLKKQLCEFDRIFSLS
jgi:hypothetical protein